MPGVLVKSSEINFRCDFALLCNARGVRVAVEIGTDLGSFAHMFMSRFQGEHLLCVDPYVGYNELPLPRDADLMMAVQVLMPWHGRVRIFRCTSTEAAANMPWFLRNKIDFVYIDGDHDYDKVAQDIKTWWAMLSEKGILAGHDYDESHPGVMQAVNEFVRDSGVNVRTVTGDNDGCHSWYAYKQEPAYDMNSFFDKTVCPNKFHKGY